MDIHMRFMGLLSCGATTIILETPISLLDEEFINNILINYKINILYLPVTLIRLMKSIFNNKKIKTKYLKTLGSMGEPLAPSVGEWFAKYFSLKNKAIVNTYYQTETGGIICSPRYTESNKTSPHGSVGKPVTTFLNINNKIKKFDKEFIIKNLWPGCMINLVNGKKRMETNIGLKKNILGCLIFHIKIIKIIFISKEEWMMLSI